ncbi:hypothetical protein C3F09_03570 [candidate division GN15 bacterium]|uniref:Outer membrane protein beta-barrel domain-containing protein n=1 Tax=candidate division GN15 bacterium TaxID=2072418 RepID=A0A855X4J5_9BACT|nr:MAG: hypothetical protein C3F09_03570 [candidate division GN15 bacterium]
MGNHYLATCFGGSGAIRFDKLRQFSVLNADMPKITIPALVVLMLVLVWCQVSADPVMNSNDFWNKRGYFAGNLGFIGTGKFRMDGHNINTQPGFTFGVKFDIRWFDHVYWGVSADVHRLYVQDTGQYFLDLCLNVKRFYFGRSSQVGFRPGIGIGFGHLTQFRNVASTEYLMTRVTLEIIFFSETRVGWIVEVGLIGAPTGGNRETSINYGPVPLFRVGAMF